MRLQSLNCPNCGSPLRTENDTQICDSCGSVFKIDYDDSDVAYEQVRIKQAQYQNSQNQQQSRGVSKARIIAIVVVVVVAVFSMTVMMSIARFLSAARNANYTSSTRATTTERTTAPTETTVSPYLLISASDITADSEFVDNAIASVKSCVNADRKNDTVIEYRNGFTNWNMTGDAEIYACYLLTSEKENRLCFLVKITYAKDGEEDVTKEVYDCLYLKNITVGTDGKIASNYAVRSDRGDGADDWTWMAALDSDQLYRSAILGKSGFSRETVALPGLEQVASDASDAGDFNETPADGDIEDTADGGNNKSEGDPDTGAAEG